MYEGIDTSVSVSLYDFYIFFFCFVYEIFVCLFVLFVFSKEFHLTAFVQVFRQPKKKKLEFHERVPFWQNWKIAKMALLNSCMKFKFFLPKSILLKHYENGNKKKNIYNLSQGPQNPGFMQKKVQKGNFLKKDSRELNFLFVLGSFESPKGLECQIRSGYFFGCLKTCTSSVSPLSFQRLKS